MKIDLSKVYELTAAGQDRHASRELMSMLMKAEHQGDFKKMDWILLEANVTKMSIHSLVALVRCSYAAREQLPNWQQTYERCWMEVKKRDRDPKSLFVGLQELTWL